MSNNAESPTGVPVQRMVRLLLDSDIGWSLDRPCAVKVVIPGLKCPLCQTPGIRRHGAHYDHEWRCGNGCDMSWDPGKTYLLVECETPNGKSSPATGEKRSD